MSRNNPDDELQPLTAFLPGLDLGAGLRAPDKKAGAGKRPRTTITPIERRLIDAAAADQADQSILYQHTVFCQTGMPYRDPGEDVRVWDRSNGHAALRITAGSYWGPVRKRKIKHVSNLTAQLGCSPLPLFSELISRPYAGKSANENRFRECKVREFGPVVLDSKCSHKPAFVRTLDLGSCRTAC